VSETGTLLTLLECRACCSQVDPDRPVGACPTCGQTLLATYRWEALAPDGMRRRWAEREASLWRYRELLPVRRSEFVTTLGEGFSPVLTLGESPDAPGVRLLLKDDGQLPTGSFKARGMAVAVSRARELGLKELYVPSAGNAGIALAAYCARGAVRARVYLPERTAPAVAETCRAYGADVVAVPGTIREAGAAAREAERGRGSFDMSTLREPYRVEGKKTMGLEIFEQLKDGDWPDAIVYPTGGGTGLVGMDKAFEELRSLGLLERAPRLIAVQPEGCAPVVRALRDEATQVTPWESPWTIAPGLLVPAPFSSERILEAVRRTRGGGSTVPDEAILDGMAALARRHGVSASPEGAAPYAALPELLRTGLVRAGETVLLYNTGTGWGFSLTALRSLLAARPEGPTAPSG
jgi:threonine synthase